MVTEDAADDEANEEDDADEGLLVVEDFDADEGATGGGSAPGDHLVHS